MRLTIERRVAFHIVRHVRDVHLQFVAPIGQLGHMNRIVKITRCLAVNCDDRQIAEVATASQIRFGNSLGLRFRFRDYFRGKNMWQMMLPNNDLNVDADVT